MEIASASCTAHAKAILLGEHSIVYGGSAIVAPIPSLKLTATATLSSGETPSFLMSGREVSREELRSGYPGIDLALSFFPCPEGFTISLSTESNIPESRGLGSSAASAHAVINALYKLFENADYISDSKIVNPIEKSEIYGMVKRCEDAVHIRASGVDQCGVMSSVTRLFHIPSEEELKKADERRHAELVLGETLGVPLSSLNAQLVIADTGKNKSTGKAVGAIRSRVNSKDQDTIQALKELGSLPDRALEAWNDRGLKEIGSLMNRAQEILSSLGLSTSDLDVLTTSMRASGALGSKLSGGGCGGIAIGLFDSIDGASEALSAIETLGYRGWRIDL